MCGGWKQPLDTFNIRIVLRMEKREWKKKCVISISNATVRDRPIRWYNKGTTNMHTQSLEVYMVVKHVRPSCPFVHTPRRKIIHGRQGQTWNQKQKCPWAGGEYGVGDFCEKIGAVFKHSQPNRSPLPTSQHVNKTTTTTTNWNVLMAVWQLRQGEPNFFRIFFFFSFILI